jgi:transcriptional antiterminator RfaH
MNWYLIHTKPRLEQTALMNLQQQGYRCYLPMMNIEKLLRGRLKLVSEPLFPRYLFVQLGTDLLAKSWAPIRSTIGVSRLVSFGSEPAKINEALIDTLRSFEVNQQQAQPLYSPGERLLITQGAFAGIEAVFKMPQGEQRVIVLIDILSKPVKLSLAPASLRKI